MADNAISQALNCLFLYSSYTKDTKIHLAEVAIYAQTIIIIKIQNCTKFGKTIIDKGA